MHIKHAKPGELAKVAAEFIGTFMLVFTVCLNNTTKGLDNELAHALGIFAPTAVACVLMVLIYSLGAISGAHLNPAVTVACYFQEAIDMAEGIKYIIVQCAAGVLAGLATVLLEGSTATSNATTAHPVGPLTSAFAIGAPLVEFLYTFMLCFTVLNVCVANKTKGNKFYGVAIGFCVIAGGYGGGYVSGGYFNPAIVLGVNFMGLSWWGALYVPIYCACHLAAALVAPVFLHIVRPETKLDLKHVNPITQFFYKLEDKLDPEDTAEFLGAMFLALSISLNALANQYDIQEGSHSGNPGGSLSVGAALMCMIFALGDVSGGLFNPAVTIAYLGRFHGTGCGVGKEKLQDMQTSPKEGIKYFLAQTLGALAGTGLTIAIWLASGWGIAAVGPQVVGANTTDPTDMANTEHYTLGQAFFAETFGTFLYCFVVICVSTTFTPLKEYKAFAIGCTLIAGGYAFGPLSGGILNPAITIADCVVRMEAISQPLTPLMYVGGELLGGILAAVVFRFITHSHEFEEQDGNPEGYERLSIPAGYGQLEGGKPMTG